MSDEIVDVIETVTEFTQGDVRALVAGGVVGGLLLGTAIGYAIARKKLDAKYKSYAEQEIAEARAVYNRLSKEKLEVTQDVSPLVADAVDALERYKGKVADVETDEDTEPDVQVNVEVNVFEGSQSDHEWDQDAEDALRTQLDDGVPYVISEEEWSEGQLDYKQVTLTFYEEDQVLSDEKDEAIPLISEVIGDNLDRFGHGTGDARTMFIRNDKLSMDFEVIKHGGSFAREVMGFQHSDQPLRMRHPNRTQWPERE